MKKIYMLIVMLVLAATSLMAQNQIHSNPQQVKFVQNTFGFVVDAPVDLITKGVETSKTNAGVDYTSIIYAGSLPNDDSYFAWAGIYPFTVSAESMNQALNAFAGGVKGTVIEQKNMTISGNPAVRAIISTQDGARTQRFMYIFTYKGNHAYQFAFGTYTDTTSDMEAVKRFFSSIQIQ